MPSDRLQTLMNAAKVKLRRSGSLEPLLLIEGRKNLAVAIPELPPTSDQRRALMYVMGRQFAYLKPWRLTAVMDAYIKISDLGEPVSMEGSLIDDPRAKDCVIVAELTRQGQSRLLVCTYERVPTLRGLHLNFDQVQEPPGEGEFYLLEAFFDAST